MRHFGADRRNGGSGPYRGGRRVGGCGYGITLCVFGMVVLADLLGGTPACLGFGAVAWASCVGQVGSGLAIAAAAGGAASGEAPRT